MWCQVRHNRPKPIQRLYLSDPLLSIRVRHPNADRMLPISVVQMFPTLTIRSSPTTDDRVAGTQVAVRLRSDSHKIGGATES